MKLLFFIFLVPFALIAFEPLPVTPSPVVGFQEISFFDKFQQVDRKLLVWYPVNASVNGNPSDNPWDLFNIALNASPIESRKKLPVIVISHGYLGSPYQLSWLIRDLVHNQFIVVGIEHRDLIEGKIHPNLWQRPQDITQIIDQFEASALAKIANLNQIGIAGYSLGGTTAIWIACGRTIKLDSLVPETEYSSSKDFAHANKFLPFINKEMMTKDWCDHRVKAAFIMAPAWSWLFDEESLKKITIPTYLIASSADEVLATSKNAGFFAQHIPRSIYQTIPGKAGHYVFISALSEKQRKIVDRNFLFQDDASVNRQWIQSQVGEEAVLFFNSVFESDAR